MTRLVSQDGPTVALPLSSFHILWVQTRFYVLKPQVCEPGKGERHLAAGVFSRPSADPGSEPVPLFQLGLPSEDGSCSLRE